MKKFLVTAAVLSGLVFAATGCGGADASANGSGGAGEGGVEKTEVTVGVLPIADYAAVYWAKDHGFFEKAGLDVEITPLQGGPVGVQKVVAGQLDFSFTNPISSTIAVAGGAPATTVVLSSSVGEGSLNVFVKPESPIQDIEDLDGKTVGVNTLNNIGDVSFRNLVAHEGLSTQPSWVEVPFNEMIAGIQSGSIEAGYLPEPFSSAAKGAGLRPVADLTVEPNTHLPAATFIASDSFVAKNPNTTRAFADAMYAAGNDISSKEEEFRTWLPGVSGVPESVAKAMILPSFEKEMSVHKLQGVADILAKQGLIKKELDVREFTFTGK